MFFAILIFVLISANSSEATDAYWNNFGDYFEEIMPFAGGNENYVVEGIPNLDWYTVQEWEKKICSQDLSTEFDYDYSFDEGYDHSAIYGLTIAVNAQLDSTGIIEDEKEIYLFILSWYIQGLPTQGSDKKIKYSLTAKHPITKINLSEDTTKKEFSLVTGDSGFYSIYTNNKYNEIILTIDNNPKTYAVLDNT